MKAWRKLDKYYLMLFGVMLVLAALTIYTFRQIFSNILKAQETMDIKESELKIDKGKLEEAYSKISEKKVVRLDVGESVTISEEAQ
ncbi:hypothetical protein A2V80_02470 [Candidatus Woesebacteria bacterium RBG_16_39_8b]|uniref:Uncharacterized protein n=1 Tax=Candidatus Woesebacteria bacterium RBG_16_39_8b TaxID=1802482 RepID=A0A1F7XCV4_9BACT|nr:MAG: hypothetical protein A2V80_02470 [Candidatus Woesebacteria bacterium RBG_16_39_8b]